MKVNIGPYKNVWFGPYQTAELLKFFGFSEDTIDKVGEYLANSKYDNFCKWVYEHNPLKERREIVKIDNFDVWNMDHTLAIIILPMLKLLKEKKHGAPSVDDCDVPDYLKSMNAPRVKNDWDTDENWFLRWQWVLDEEIWAFTQYTIEWEEQYHSGISDLTFIDNAVGHGPNHTLKIDFEGMRKHQDRMNNGFRLFGLYYSGHWD